MKDLENSELKSLALQWVTEALNNFEETNSDNHSDEVLDDLWNVHVFVKNTRRKGTFGTYRFSRGDSFQNRIEVYPKNFRFQRIEDFKDTVLHELAHHFTRVFFGHDVPAHGREWKSMCHLIGCDDSATHRK